MMLVARNFTCFILYIFAATKLWSSDFALGKLHAVMMIACLGQYFMLTCGIVSMAHFARKEAYNSLSCVFKLAYLKKFESFSNTIVIFAQRLIHRAPKFSCGMFDFDLNLAFKVFAN